jgi:hypothetical protein
MKKFFLLLLLSANINFQTIDAQQLFQTIRGKVVDKESKIPLIGVTLVIEASVPPLGTITNVNGEFRFEKLNVGRYNIVVSCLGYESKTIPDIILGAGKEVVLNIEITESVIELNEVVINGKAHKAESLNKMSSVSARSFTVEETKRYAGSINDPARMAVSFAGVTGDPDGNNDIVVRGNSPRGMLWRLEGIEIPNPNHFAEEGSSSGPISILNSTTLDNSDFFTGAFPAEYGNAYSGVFDINLRKGNNQKKEYSFQAGFLGTDCSIEGPFTKKYTGSYLLNYRYSTLAILNSIGIRIEGFAVPKFQDLTYNLYFPTKRTGTFTLFGIGGISNIHEEDKIYENNFETDMGVIGVSHQYHLNNKTYLKSVLAVTATLNKWKYTEDDDATDFYYEGQEDFTYKTIKASVSLNKKINARNTAKTGIIYSDLNFNLFDKDYSLEDSVLVTNIDRKGRTGLWQGYAGWKYRPTKKLTFNSGMHLMYFLLNSNYSVEPRIGVRWEITPKQYLSAGFGMHSKIETITNYYAQKELEDGKIGMPNKNIDLAKAIHYVMGYENRITKNLYLKLELYYQYLYKIPIEDNDTSYFSALNYSWGYTSTPLVNKGTGYNYGLELTLEKFFDNNYFFLFTCSLFDSKYTGGDGIVRNTVYNGNYVANMLAGKEFPVGKKTSGNNLSINVRGIWAGGRRYTPVHENLSREKGYTVRDWTRPFAGQFEDYVRFDLKISYKRNRKHTTRYWELDIQNATNNMNVSGNYWDRTIDGVTTWTQLGIVPVFNYRIEF